MDASILPESQLVNVGLRNLPIARRRALLSQIWPASTVITAIAFGAKKVCCVIAPEEFQSLIGQNGVVVLFMSVLLAK